jgi:RNA polymerase-binding transcription factor DksA
MNIDTQAHLTTLRGLLEFERKEARTDLHALQLARGQRLADATPADVSDHKDAAAAGQQSDVSDATEQRLRQELKRCEAALRRLDEERYGDCIDCGEPIPWPRLLAQPAAERCAACQGAYERGAALSVRP